MKIDNDLLFRIDFVMTDYLSKNVTSFMYITKTNTYNMFFKACVKKMYSNLVFVSKVKVFFFNYSS